jgi:hypothetical protein
MLTFDEQDIAHDVRFQRISLEGAKSKLKLGFEVQSAIGHQSTADVLSKLLDMEIPVNRTEIKLKRGDILIVFQLATRLPEGQVLSKEEVMELYKQGKAYFVMVEVV